MYTDQKIGADNGKLSLTLSNVNKLSGQLEVDFIDNVNIKEVQLGKKGLYLNKKGKSKLELKFSFKLWNLSWSVEHLNEAHDKSYNLDRAFEGDLNDNDNDQGW